MKYLIKGGRVIDPANSLDGVRDIFVAGGKIEDIGEKLDLKADLIIDANGKIVAPGFVDMHTHLREPGREDEETMSTGTRAAVKGGFTSVACMPNTDPVPDGASGVKMVKDAIKKDAIVNVYIIGAITRSRAGKELNQFGRMKKEGVIAVSDDGSCIQDEAIMLKALKQAKESNLLVIDHCEDAATSGKGVINKSFISTKMGLRGIPKESEYAIVKRDIDLAREAKARIHIAHVSCKESVEIIRKAKREGIDVTAETAPHYFALTEECCVTYDTNTKMNPPLRAKEDVDAIKKGLSDGTIDAIATDHAPHTDSEKDVEFEFAPFGIIGLETALSIAAMELVDKKVLSWAELIRKMSTNPAGILGVKGGSLKKKDAADIIIIDPAREYIYKKDTIESKSKNSPFIGWALKSGVSYVFVRGKLVMEDGIITV